LLEVTLALGIGGMAAAMAVTIGTDVIKRERARADVMNIPQQLALALKEGRTRNAPVSVNVYNEEIHVDFNRPINFIMQHSYCGFGMGAGCYTWPDNDVGCAPIMSVPAHCLPIRAALDRLFRDYDVDGIKELYGPSTQSGSMMTGQQIMLLTPPPYIIKAPGVTFSAPGFPLPTPTADHPTAGLRIAEYVVTPKGRVLPRFAGALDAYYRDITFHSAALGRTSVMSILDSGIVDVQP
jgi:hypothetical protein